MTNKRKKTEDIVVIEEESDDERYFLRPDAVSEHLYCSVCQDVYNHPMRAPCGHSFCEKCITSWLKQSKTCPEDRKQIKKNELHHDFILENIIGDQMVACPFRKHGCGFIGQLASLSSHKKQCTFNPINLPNFLREDLKKTSDKAPEVSTSGNVSPVMPSLKLRLFSAGEEQRQLLCTMFDKNMDDTAPKRDKMK